MGRDPIGPAARRRPAGVLSVSHDVTDQRRAEAALAESEEHHRFTVELAPQIPFVVDAQGKMLEISSRWTEVTGQPREAALDAGWRSVRQQGGELEMR